MLSRFLMFDDETQSVPECMRFPRGLGDGRVHHWFGGCHSAGHYVLQGRRFVWNANFLSGGSRWLCWLAGKAVLHSTRRNKRRDKGRAEQFTSRAVPSTTINCERSLAVDTYLGFYTAPTYPGCEVAGLNPQPAIYSVAHGATPNPFQVEEVSKPRIPIFLHPSSSLSPPSSIPRYPFLYLPRSISALSLSLSLSTSLSLHIAIPPR